MPGKLNDILSRTEALRQLAALLHKYGLTAITLEDAGGRVSLRREPMPDEIVVSHIPTVLHELPLEETSAVGDPVESPFMGIFYRSRRPSEPVFVEEGDRVDEGDPLCLLEANKVFSELPSPYTGVVTKITKENGALVHPGDVLFYIEREPPAG